MTPLIIASVRLHFENLFLKPEFHRDFDWHFYDSNEDSIKKKVYPYVFPLL